MIRRSCEVAVDESVREPLTKDPLFIACQHLAHFPTPSFAFKFDGSNLKLLVDGKGRA